MKFSMPSPTETRSEVMKLYREDTCLQEQQTEIRDQLFSNREAKERFIESYLQQLNVELGLVGLLVEYQEFVGVEDGTPNGILAYSFFILKDEGKPACAFDCPQFFHPEHKLNCLVKFLEIIQEHANKKLNHMTLEAQLERRLGKQKRIKL